MLKTTEKLLPRSTTSHFDYHYLTIVKEIKFPYGDMHGNLKVVLNTPIKNRYVVGFKTKEDVGQILASLGTNDYEGISYEEY